MPILLLFLWLLKNSQVRLCVCVRVCLLTFFTKHAGTRHGKNSRNMLVDFMQKPWQNIGILSVSRAVLPASCLLSSASALPPGVAGSAVSRQIISQCEGNTFLRPTGEITFTGLEALFGRLSASSFTTSLSILLHVL